MNKQAQKMEEKITHWLDESIAHLDAETESKLTQARNRALQTRPGILPLVLLPPKRWLLPLGGMASALVLALMLTLNPIEQKPGGAGAVLGDMDVLAASEELEFYEDIDFYQWLDGELALLDDAENA